MHISQAQSTVHSFFVLNYQLQSSTSEGFSDSSEGPQKSLIIEVCNLRCPKQKCKTPGIHRVKITHTVSAKMFLHVWPLAFLPAERSLQVSLSPDVSATPSPSSQNPGVLPPKLSCPSRWWWSLVLTTPYYSGG